MVCPLRAGEFDINILIKLFVTPYTVDYRPLFEPLVPIVKRGLHTSPPQILLQGGSAYLTVITIKIELRPMEPHSTCVKTVSHQS